MRENTNMKSVREHDSCKMSIFQQLVRSATKIKRPWRSSPGTSSSVMSGHGRPGRAIAGVISLALLLFSLAGIPGVITGAYALSPDWLSVRSLAETPAKGQPPRHTPTPTPVPSSTATATLSPTLTPSPAPSPTFTAVPTKIATAPAGATPTVKVTVPSISGQAGRSQRQTPVSTSPTDSTGSPAAQRNGESPSPFLIMGILSGIAAIVLLVAIGPVLLRRRLMPARNVKLPPGGAAPWQRVRDSANSTDNNSTQNLPVTGTLLPTTGNSTPITKGNSSTTSHLVPKRRSALLPVRHSLKPTKLKAINRSSLPARARDSNLTRQNGLPMRTIRERAKEREKTGWVPAKED